MKTSCVNPKLHIGSWVASVDKENNIWLSSYDFNGLFKYNLNEEKMLLIHRFKDISVSSEALHMDMCILGAKIYIFPLQDKVIRVYDTEKEEEYSIEMPFDNKSNCTSVVCGDYAWIFDNHKKIYAFSIENEKFDNDNKLCELINSQMNDAYSGKYNITFCDDYVLILNKEKKELIEIDKNFFSVKSYVLDNIPFEIYKVIYKENMHWVLLLDSQDVFSFGDSLDTLKKYCCNEVGFIENKNNVPYSDIVSFDGKFYLLNYYADGIRKINLNESKVENVYSSIGKVGGLLCFGGVFSKAVFSGDEVYLIPQMGRYIVCLCHNEIKELNAEYFMESDDNVYKQIIGDMMKKQNAIVETDFGLNEYIQYLNCV